MVLSKYPTSPYAARMRFSIHLPTDRVELGDEFVSGQGVAEVACCAEAAGFDACYVTDHPFPSDRWLADGGHHALDMELTVTLATLFPLVRVRLATTPMGRWRV